MNISLRPTTPHDEDAIWRLFQGAIAGGDAFVFAPETPRSEALAYWFQPGAFSFVLEVDGTIGGAYVLKPNQPGLGSHVANGAYTVAVERRGLGLGRILGEHSLRQAKLHGFRAMQFNAVVATNLPAVQLWTSLGFQIVGTLPGAFRHRQRGDVDLYVMFRTLDDIR